MCVGLVRQATLNEQAFLVIFVVLFLGLAATTFPQKSPLLKKGVCHSRALARETI
jgi:hypothetical protein